MLLLCFPDRDALLKAYIHGHYRLNSKTKARVWVDSYTDKRPERGRTQFDNEVHRITHFQHYLGRNKTREALHAFHDLNHEDAHQLARHLGLAGEDKGKDKKDLMESIHGALVNQRKLLARRGPFDRDADKAFAQQEKERKAGDRDAIKPAEKEKSAGYSLPDGDVAKDWEGNGRPVVESPQWKPTKRQQVVMDAVARAIDNEAFYNKDIIAAVAKDLNVDQATLQRNTKGTENGEFGTDVYYASRAVHARRLRTEEGSARAAIELQSGDTIGTLLVNGKRTTGITVDEIKPDGTIVVHGKRGNISRHIVMSHRDLKKLLDDTKTQGARKDGYDGFVSAMRKTRTAMSGAGGPALTSATLGRNPPNGPSSIADSGANGGARVADKPETPYDLGSGANVSEYRIGRKRDVGVKVRKYAGGTYRVQVTKDGLRTISKPLDAVEAMFDLRDKLSDTIKPLSSDEVSKLLKLHSGDDVLEIGASKPAPAAKKPAKTAPVAAQAKPGGTTAPSPRVPSSDQSALARQQAMAPFQSDYPVYGTMTVTPLNSPYLRPGHTLVAAGFRRIKGTPSKRDQEHWKVAPAADWYRYGVARNEHGELYGFAEYPKHYQQRGRDLLLTFEPMGTEPLEDGKVFRGLNSAISDLYQHHARAERTDDLFVAEKPAASSRP